MITQLYTFSAGSYVVAEEWNANFRTLYKANLAHEESIVDMQTQVALSNGDLTELFSVINSQFNSFAIAGNSVTVAPECEYYKTLAGGQELIIDLGNLSDAETRILINLLKNIMFAWPMNNCTVGSLLLQSFTI